MIKTTGISYINNNGVTVLDQGYMPSAPFLHEPIFEHIQEIKKKKTQTISIFWLPVYILPWFIIFLLVLMSYYILPTPLLKETESSYPNRFIGERAKILSHELAYIGPKVVGSDANDVQAVGFLLNEITKIENAANSIHFIEHDVQTSSGCFEIGSLTTYYQGIQNVIVKISPRNRTTTNSLLINTHYDTVPGSPGAGDAGILVVVMLEVLRVLSHLPNTLQHAVVFLFNSAEEFELNGAHQFITQHIWAKDVRAVINMDACGTGGKEILFQSTAYPWLMDYYKNSVPHPTASVLGDEIFKMGIIPSDTDFRIFREFGNLRGMDFAIYRNGYVYHTEHDAPELIPMSTFQNTGDNILAFTKAVANADELGSTLHDADDENLIFFDWLGWFMISYSTRVAVVVNVVVSALSLIGIIISITCFGRDCESEDDDVLQSKLDGFNNVPQGWAYNFGENWKIVGKICAFYQGTGFWRMVFEFSAIVIIQFLSICLSVGIIILLAFVYDVGSRSMSWFSNQWLLFGIYFCPLFFCLGIAPSLYVMFRKTEVIKQSYFVQMFQHAQCFILVLLTLALTGLGIRSTFIFVISIIFYTLTTYINCFTRLQLRDGLWIVIHVIGQIFPFMFYSYYTIIIMDMFVPIQARNGTMDNPDNMIGIITIALGILAGGFLIPPLYMFKRSVLVILGFLVVFTVFGILMATDLGFPYRHAVSPRRFWIYHTQRTFHNFDGSVRESDSGYYMREMDRHYNDYTSDFVPHMKYAEKASKLCATEMMCGLPAYQSAATSTSSETSYWIPSASPSLPFQTRLTLLNETNTSSNVKRFYFQLSGTDHMALSISPLPGNTMIRWSFLDTAPLARGWGSRELYIMMIIYGVDDNPINFYVDIEKSTDEVPSMDIAVVSHFTYHKDYDTTDFKEFLDYFPNWAHITSWISAFDSWTF